MTCPLTPEDLAVAERESRVRQFARFFDLGSAEAEDAIDGVLFLIYAQRSANWRGSRRRLASLAGVPIDEVPQSYIDSR